MTEHLSKVFHDKTFTSISLSTGISKLTGDDFCFRTRLCQSHSRLQARDDLNSHFSGSDVSLSCVRAKDQRGKYFLFVVRSQGLREDANDGYGTMVQNNLFFHDAWIRTESTVPAIVRKHDNGITSGDLLLLPEVAAKQWRYTERG